MATDELRLFSNELELGKDLGHYFSSQRHLSFLKYCTPQGMKYLEFCKAVGLSVVIDQDSLPPAALTKKATSLIERWIMPLLPLYEPAVGSFE